MSRIGSNQQERGAQPTTSKGGSVRARIAFHLSLWPLVLFVSFLGVFYILLIVGAVFPASSRGGTVLESIFIFVLQAVQSPAMAVPLAAIVAGFIMAMGPLNEQVNPKAIKRATSAAVLAFLSLGVYAFLLFSTSGIGR